MSALIVGYIANKGKPDIHNKEITQQKQMFTKWQIKSRDLRPASTLHNICNTQITLSALVNLNKNTVLCFRFSLLFFTEPCLWNILDMIGMMEQESCHGTDEFTVTLPATVKLCDVFTSVF